MTYCYKYIILIQRVSRSLELSFAPFDNETRLGGCFLDRNLVSRLFLKKMENNDVYIDQKAELCQRVDEYLFSFTHGEFVFQSGREL